MLQRMQMDIASGQRTWATRRRHLQCAKCYAVLQCHTQYNLCVIQS